MNKYKQLAKKYFEEHEKGDWSSFDRTEVMAINLFAEWLDNQPVEVSQTQHIENNSGEVIGVNIGNLNNFV